MRRFTTTSVTMLAGLVFVPACGAVVGIDTDRIPDNGESDGSVATIGNGPTTDDGGPNGTGDGSVVDSGPPPKLGCDAKCALSLFGFCNAKTGRCERACGPLVSCTVDMSCPEGNDCAILCHKAECAGGSCKGGISCTYECAESGTDCKKTTCESPTCNFNCRNDSCSALGKAKGDDDDDDKDAAECTKSVKTCTYACQKDDGHPCDKVIRCCMNTTTCPPGSKNDCGGG